MDEKQKNCNVRFATLNNEGEIVMTGLKTKKEAINYVANYPEEHMPSFLVKEVEDYNLWDCFVKQT